MDAALILHAGVTLFLCGLIWTVQIVHYPLFARVGAKGFEVYEREHQRRIAWVVAPPMIAELATGLWLLLRPPPEAPPWALGVGTGLIASIWISTAIRAVPRHRQLSQGFSNVALAGLIRANWERTIAWSLRSVLVLWLVWRMIGA